MGVAGVWIGYVGVVGVWIEYVGVWIGFVGVWIEYVGVVDVWIEYMGVVDVYTEAVWRVGVVDVREAWGVGVVRVSIEWVLWTWTRGGGENGCCERVHEAGEWVLWAYTRRGRVGVVHETSRVGRRGRAQVELRWRCGAVCAMGIIVWANLMAASVTVGESGCILTRTVHCLHPGLLAGSK